MLHVCQFSIGNLLDINKPQIYKFKSGKLPEGEALFSYSLVIWYKIREESKQPNIITPHNFIEVSCLIGRILKKLPVDSRL